MNHKIKQARKNIGLTQVEVAKNANCATRCYQEYEAGRRVPNACVAILIAQSLNTTVEELFNQPMDSIPQERPA